MFISASTRCFSELRFEDACQQLADLEYEKVDVWLDEGSNHLKPSEVATVPEDFARRCRELTRVLPIAFTLEHDVPAATIRGVCAAARILRITQVTVPASPLGTPFNSEIDRLKEFVGIANEHGIRMAIHTKTGTLTEDAHTAVELCQSVRGLGLALDPSYYICSPRQQTWDQVFPYVLHTFLRDSTDKELQIQVGLGEIDYGRLVQQLEREGYTRALSVDFFPSLMDPETRPLELRKLRLLLETLV